MNSGSIGLTFGKNFSLLLGCIHNSKKAVALVENALKKTEFDKILVELNLNHYLFIRNFDIQDSEFYPVIFKKNLILIDTPLEREISKYQTLTCYNNRYDAIVSYKYNKMFYHKLCDLVLKNGNAKDSSLLNKFYIDHSFYQTFMIFRNAYMLSRIKRNLDKKILVIVGRNHFDFLYNELIRI